MFQKPIFGPKNENFEEILVHFPKEVFLAPNKEDSDSEDNVSPTLSMKNTIKDPEKCFPDLIKKKSLAVHPKIDKWNVFLLIRRLTFHLKYLVFHQMNQKFLSSLHYKILQEDVLDPCNEKTVKKTRLTIFSKFINEFAKFFPIISPSHKCKLFWDLFIMMIILCQFFIIIPLITFPEEPFHNFYYNWLIISTPIQFCDTIMNLCCGFLKRGQIILCRKKILLRYARKKLIYDILNYILFLLYFVGGGTQTINFLQILYFSNYPAFRKLFKKLEEIIDLGGKIEVFIALFKLLTNFLFFAHCIACIWLYLGYNSSSNEQTWLTSSPAFIDKSIYFHYLISLYWSIATISTTNYGDIAPKNSLEFFFGSFFMILVLFFWGYSINYLGCVFLKFSKEENSKRNYFEKAKEVLRKNEIDSSTHLKVKSHMNFLFKKQKKQATPEERRIFDNLPMNLKKSILSQTIGKLFFNIPLFAKNFSKDFLLELLLIMKPCYFEANSFIYKRGDNINLGIYVLDEGETNLCFSGKDEEIILQNFKKGNYFGEYEFFTRNERAFDMKSLTNSTAYFIEYEDFIRILKNFPDDFEKYHMIKDKLVLSADSSYLYQECLSCKKNSHVLFKCPMINPLITRTHLIDKITASKPQQRQVFSRNKRAKFNSRKNASLIQKNIILHFIDNEKNDGDTYNMLPSGSFDESEPSPLLKSEKHDKLSEISEKENEDFGEYSFTNLKPIKKNIKKMNIENSNSEINSEQKINAENFDPHDSSDIKSFCEEKTFTKITIKKKDEVNDFDFIKSYKNYFPNFNCDIIIMLLNNEFYYRNKTFEKKNIIKNVMQAKNRLKGNKKK